MCRIVYRFGASLYYANASRFTEEALRLRSPTQGLSTRITSQDEVFQGVKVPKGSSLHLRWAAGNRDPDEFERADEVMLLGTSIEVLPIVSLDGQPVGDGRPGPVARRLQAAFRSAVASAPVFGLENA